MAFSYKVLNEEYISTNKAEYKAFIDELVKDLDSEGTKYKFIYPFANEYFSFIRKFFQEIERSLFFDEWRQEAIDNINRICELNIILRGILQRLNGKLDDKHFKRKLIKKEIFPEYFKKSFDKLSFVEGSYKRYIKHLESTDEFNIAMTKLLEIYKDCEGEALKRKYE